MKKQYNASGTKYIYDPIKVDEEVKKIIEKKEAQGIELKEVCKFLNRDYREIYRILGRKYEVSVPSYLRK